MIKNRSNFEILTALECAYSNYQMAEISCLGTKGEGEDMCIIQKSLRIRRVCSDIRRGVFRYSKNVFRYSLECSGIRWSVQIELLYKNLH
jgi:hypothetical protein